MLEVNNLSVSFSEIKVVQNLNFKIKENTILGVVGESGSGKSISSLSILGLLPKSAKTEGEILLNNTDLLKFSEKQFQKIRVKEIAMIFQEPMSSLNPTLKCGYQVAEILKEHTNLSFTEIKEEVIALFEKVKLPRPEAIYNSYPHQNSHCL